MIRHILYVFLGGCLFLYGRYSLPLGSREQGMVMGAACVLGWVGCSEIVLHIWQSSQFDLWREPEDDPAPDQSAAIQAKQTKQINRGASEGRIVRRRQ